MAKITAVDGFGADLAQAESSFEPGSTVDLTLELGSAAGSMAELKFDFTRYGFEKCSVKYQRS